ncbi:VOC family protein [Alphaproteobacteria bacterium]|nr:VOC family protein [Alphaproteobacteria bacterium]
MIKTADTGTNEQAVIDHIVFGCDQLDSGTAYLEAMLAASFSIGGKHHMMATHNRLLRLQNSIYLEAISIDHDAAATTGDIGRRRWFSLDDDRTRQKLAISPQPLCWVVAVDDIHQATAKCGYNAGRITRVTRDGLEWWLTIPDDGSLAESGLLPSFIEWPNGRNPANRLPENGTILQNIILVHPNPQFITSCIDGIGIDGPIVVRQGQSELIFQLQTSAGELLALSNVVAQ